MNQTEQAQNGTSLISANVTDSFPTNGPDSTPNEFNWSPIVMIVLAIIIFIASAVCCWPQIKKNRNERANERANDPAINVQMGNLIQRLENQNQNADEPRVFRRPTMGH